ncbi:MAG: anthranilate synthase component I family protein [Phycisphaerales bacterium JB060]
MHGCGPWQEARGHGLTPQGDTAFAGFVSYEIGRVLEPTSTAPRPGAMPENARPDSAWGLGGWAALEACPEPAIHPCEGRTEERAYRLGAMRSAWGRTRYVDAVARAIELIHAGDMYQVNLTHALVGRFEGSTRALFADLAQAASPAMGCYLELPPLPDGRRRAVLSLSPELLLRYDAATRTLTTEPMKGTRPATDAGLDDLREAEKDKAELAMIVDLMRNDLGRVSTIGSVRVDQPRILERHGPAEDGVWQASARVSGRLQDGLSLDDALRATLPAGSITGAPKVRAMQVIHQMEPTPRGPYCGAIGIIDAHGNAELAVGIRTAVVVGDELRYSVGAGVVAQSEPQAEWAETLSKAGPLRAIGAVIEDDTP